MRVGTFFFAGLVLAGCSSTPSTPTVCTPGQSIACTGAGGCSGGQACKSDGSGYEACQCGTTGDGGGGGDASPEAGGDGAAAWLPSALGSSLSLWLDGDVGLTLTNTDVTQWADQSGNGNNATPMTGNPLPRPKVGTKGAHSVIQFNGSTDPLVIGDAASLQFPADFAVEIVTDSTKANAYEYLYSKVPTSGAPNGMQMQSAPNPSLFINNPFVLNGSVGGGTANVLDGNLHILGVRRTGTACEARVDGVATAGSSGDCGTILVNAAGAPVTLGGSYDKAVLDTADLAEIVAVKGTLSDGDVAKLEAYFKAKYGL